MQEKNFDINMTAYFQGWIFFIEMDFIMQRNFDIM